ncbi:hypothetical protein COCC4DRAFT_145650 [Bipolaris maydis ATCC 48331]|uniref:Uncharacterized protein n=2 Tax=Cochliobolus heterostrophus TaxID=5016 RepID=M2U234_COCH5|nr:uncharacterized protein COCC4DRAFT_145650 [Bipolaris maydis ATCC 48331]EMD88106.1 hypothetical protein COCHEDRAFT_1159297 [Bipolaris maydis C5]ENI02310.1 hypothetical protein COCC4DRAFT_145650 [Bipolaris maydis ATCC 48331]
MMGVSVRGCPWVSVGKWMQKGRSGQSRAEPRAVLAPDAVQPMAARACDSAAKSLVSVVARAWPCFVRLPFLDCHGHGCGVLAPTLFPAPPDAIGNTTITRSLVGTLVVQPHRLPSRNPSVPTARHKKR